MRRARFGRCKHCHAFTAHKCHRCGEWLCVFQGAPCGKLRKVKGEVGRYDLVCAPRCRKTRKDIGVPKQRDDFTSSVAQVDARIRDARARDDAEKAYASGNLGLADE